MASHCYVNDIVGYLEAEKWGHLGGLPISLNFLSFSRKTISRKKIFDRLTASAKK